MSLIPKLRLLKCVSTVQNTERNLVVESIKAFAFIAAGVISTAYIGSNLACWIFQVDETTKHTEDNSKN